MELYFEYKNECIFIYRFIFPLSRYSTKFEIQSRGSSYVLYRPRVGELWYWHREAIDSNYRLDRAERGSKFRAGDPSRVEIKCVRLSGTIPSLLLVRSTSRWCVLLVQKRSPRRERTEFVGLSRVYEEGRTARALEQSRLCRVVFALWLGTHFSSH